MKVVQRMSTLPIKLLNTSMKLFCNLVTVGGKAYQNINCQWPKKGRIPSHVSTRAKLINWLMQSLEYYENIC